MVTEEQINKESHQYQIDEYDCGNTGDLSRAFKEGAEWAIQELEPKWIDVRDKLPDFDSIQERSRVVYVYTLDGQKGEAYAYKQSTNHIFWSWKNTMPITNVTHWTLLPLPPQEQTKED